MYVCPGHIFPRSRDPGFASAAAQGCAPGSPQYVVEVVEDLPTAELPVLLRVPHLLLLPAVHTHTHTHTHTSLTQTVHKHTHAHTRQLLSNCKINHGALESVSLPTNPPPLPLPALPFSCLAQGNSITRVHAVRKAWNNCGNGRDQCQEG